jgi:hypothetical protein
MRFEHHAFKAVYQGGSERDRKNETQEKRRGRIDWIEDLNGTGPL